MSDEKKFGDRVRAFGKANKRATAAEIARLIPGVQERLVARWLHAGAVPNSKQARMFVEEYLLPFESKEKDSTVLASSDRLAAPTPPGVAEAKSSEEESPLQLLKRLADQQDEMLLLLRKLVDSKDKAKSPPAQMFRMKAKK